MAVVASKLAVANSFPDGDQAQDRTVRVCVSSKTACISLLDSDVIIKKVPPNKESKHATSVMKYTPIHHQASVYVIIELFALEVAKID